MDLFGMSSPITSDKYFFGRQKQLTFAYSDCGKVVAKPSAEIPPLIVSEEIVRRAEV